MVQRQPSNSVCPSAPLTVYGDHQAQNSLVGNVHYKHGSSLMEANWCVLSCPAMPSSDDPAGCGSNSRYLQLFFVFAEWLLHTIHHISSKIALFKRWLTQNTLKYIDYKLTKYSNETRIYEVMIRKSRENPLTLLRHKSLLTSGAWLNFFQDGGILFAISARISGTISTFS